MLFIFDFLDLVHNIIKISHSSQGAHLNTRLPFRNYSSVYYSSILYFVSREDESFEIEKRNLDFSLTAQLSPVSLLHSPCPLCHPCHCIPFPASAPPRYKRHFIFGVSAYFFGFEFFHKTGSFSSLFCCHSWVTFLNPTHSICFNTRRVCSQATE